MLLSVARGIPIDTVIFSAGHNGPHMYVILALQATGFNWFSIAVSSIDTCAVNRVFTETRKAVKEIALRLAGFLNVGLKKC